MRDHSHHIEMTREEAVNGLLTRWHEVSGKREISCERVALARSFGRVLAEDIVAKTDLPNALTCCMDSIAVHWSDFADGAMPDTARWVRGEDWEFANTGVAMPAGFDTAIVIEHVQVSEDEQSVTLDDAPSQQYAGTRAAGSQMHRGDTAVAAGEVITADIAARIASAGYSSVKVLARPRVAFIPTGNELVPPNLPFSPDRPEKYAGIGRTFESNSILVQGKVEQWGGVYVPFDIVPDNPDAIEAALHEACAVADIVVLNAGSSKGSDDWSVEVLEENGEIICHQTAHGPGHHSSYALFDGKPIVGISGPSGGASFTLNFYLRPVMRDFMGLDPAPETYKVKLAAPFPAGGPHGKPGAGWGQGGSGSHGEGAGKGGQGVPASGASAGQGVSAAGSTGHDGGRAAGFAGHGAQGGEGAARNGEHRPFEEKKPGRFFGVKPVRVELGDDGVMTAYPVKGRPGSAEAASANAYTMVAAGEGNTPPAAGDIVIIEYF